MFRTEGRAEVLIHGLTSTPDGVKVRLTGRYILWREPIGCGIGWVPEPDLTLRGNDMSVLVRNQTSNSRPSMPWPNRYTDFS
jgi:hypothetical protein